MQSSPGSHQMQPFTLRKCICNKGPHDPYFYHRVRWADMDGDGDNDLVTARAMSNGVDVIDDQLGTRIWHAANTYHTI